MNTLRNDHAEHVIHTMIQIAEYLQPHSLNARQQRAAVQFVARNAVIQTFFKDDARTFA